jgi:hypothetical protein
MDEGMLQPSGRVVFPIVLPPKALSVPCANSVVVAKATTAMSRRDSFTLNKAVVRELDTGDAKNSKGKRPLEEEESDEEEDQLPVKKKARNGVKV